MKVMKFGGGCLKDANDFREVADIILSEKETPIIVVSAVYGVTDLIVEGLEMALQSEKMVPPLLEAVADKHSRISEETILVWQQKRQVQNRIQARMKKLERLLYGVAYTGEITDSLKANILSYGERLCAQVLAGVISSMCCRQKTARALESDEIKLLTDDSFENATARLPEIKRNLNRHVTPLLQKGVVPVITGYFGCTSEGKITTFGRNGTDYSAAAITLGAGAGFLEIWKDVDGFMSADPKLVPHAQKIDRLSYYEAAELSYFGAKILHPRTVEPVIHNQIPICIRNMKMRGNGGTWLLPGSQERKDVIKSVTYNRNISVLRIHGPGVGYKPGIIGEIGEALYGLGINIFSIITSQTCINLLLDSKDSQASYQSILKLGEGTIEKVQLEDDIALVSVVGKGLQKRKGVAARVFAAVAAARINVEMISSGASEVAYYFIVKDRDVRRAILAIHDEFF